MLSQRSAFLTAAAAALLAALAMTLLPAPAAQEPGPEQKKDAPPAAAQAKAEALLTKLYAARLQTAATDRKIAQALAAELLAQGRATKDDDALRFVALRMAADLAARAGDGGTALDAIEALAAAFRVDSLALTGDVYTQVEKNTTAAGDAFLLAESALSLAGEALDADNFAAADKLLAAAAGAAAKSEVPPLAARVKQRAVEVADARKAFAAIKPLLDRADAGDEKAIAEVGKYYCLVKGNFDRGLPLLAKSGDAALKALAQRDLARPKEPRQQVDLAEDWLQLAERSAGLAQRQALRRAYFWYQAALPAAEGLTRLRAARQVEALAKLFPAAGRSVAAVEVTTERRSIPGIQKHLYGLAVSGDGKWILSAGQGEAVARLWDTLTGQQLRELGGHGAGLLSVAISPDKKWGLTCAHDNNVRLWDLDSGQEVRRFTGHKGLVRGVQFLPDGRHVLTACDDTVIRLYDINNGDKVLRELRGHTGHMNSLNVSRDGKRAISASYDASVRVWDLESGQEVRRFMHGTGVEHAALSADGRRAVSTSYDNTVKVWDVATGKELRALPHPGMVWRVAFSPDGRRVYTVSGGGPIKEGKFEMTQQNNIVRVYDVHTGKELRALGSHPGWVFGLAVSADGRVVVSGSEEGTMRVWGPQ
jgi:hypothetical protein